MDSQAPCGAQGPPSGDLLSPFCSAVGDEITPTRKLGAPQSKRALGKPGGLPGQLHDPKHHLGSLLKTWMLKLHPRRTASGLPKESVIFERTLKVVLIRKFCDT